MTLIPAEHSLVVLALLVDHKQRSRDLNAHSRVESLLRSAAERLLVSRKEVLPLRGHRYFYRAKPKIADAEPTSCEPCQGNAGASHHTRGHMLLTPTLRTHNLSAHCLSPRLVASPRPSVATCDEMPQDCIGTATCSSRQMGNQVRN